MKNQYRRGDCLKRGSWTFCKFKGEGLAKKRESGVFEGGVDTPMDTMPWVKQLKIIHER